MKKSTVEFFNNMITDNDTNTSFEDEIISWLVRIADLKIDDQTKKFDGVFLGTLWARPYN